MLIEQRWTDYLGKSEIGRAAPRRSIGYRFRFARVGTLPSTSSDRGKTGDGQP